MRGLHFFASLWLILVLAAFLVAAPPQSTKPTLGTVQMAGDQGKLKTIYQLGAKGSELHFTLDSVAFAARYPAPDDVLVAGAHERLLVVNFTVQNPLNREQKLASSSFQFTVVSPDDENYEFRGYLLSATKKTHLDQSLKPAQKVKCTVVIPIHAAGPVPKLIVQRGESKVLRYDLTGKVDRMTSSFAPNGLDLVDEFNAPSHHIPIDMGMFEITVSQGIHTQVTDEIKGRKPLANEVYIVVDVLFKNLMLKPTQIGFQYFTPELTDDSGKVYSWNHDLLCENSEESLYQDINPGQAVAGRYYFLVPRNAGMLLHMRLTHNPSGRYAKMGVQGPI